ncbi:MAG: MarR family transcriptional regulator [Clostridiales bacterium]
MKKCEIFEGINSLPRIVKVMFDDLDVPSIVPRVNKTQEKVLVLIKYNENNNMGEISKLIGIEKGSFTTLTDNLIKKGLIKRKRSDKDRRKISLVLTEKGNEVSNKIIEVMEEHLDRKLSMFSDVRKKDFFNALQTLSECALIVERNIH